VRSRALITCVIAVLALCGSNPHAVLFVTMQAETVRSVRDRLSRAAAGTTELVGKAAPASQLPPGVPQRGAWRPVVEEDQPSLQEGRFPYLADVYGYWKLRPWEPAFRSLGWTGPQVPASTTQEWPTAADGAALRELLGDTDPVIRGLAVEALATLENPDDVGRIGALLTDQVESAPALVRIESMSAMGFVLSGDERAVIPTMVWAERTVSTYARAAVQLMTGHRLDGKNGGNSTFVDWIQTHDHGRQSLWYWQARLEREHRASRRQGRLFIPGAPPPDVERLLSEASARYSAAIVRIVAELNALPVETQAEVFLLTTRGGGVDVTGPVNDYFPDGFKLRLGRERLIELLEGRNLWPESRDVSNASSLLLWRLGQLAPEILPKRDWPRVRSELETRGAKVWWTPVLESRLLPPARQGREDDLDTREGYLRNALATTTVQFASQLIAGEMVRTNLDAQWPVLTALFNDSPSGHGQDAREGVLQALGEAPHTTRKLRALVDLIDDPRNAPLLTQPVQAMGSDVYRRHAVWSLNAFGGQDYVPYKVLEDLAHEQRSTAALGELRRLGHALLQMRTRR
jgi:hypothetical protein